MSSRNITLSLATVLLSVSPVAADLDSAFADLKEGRSYRNDLRNQLRDTMVDKFIGIGFSAKPPALRDAIDEAMVIRNSSGVSNTESKQAWYIANEGLEAMLYGYLSAGNRDLLKGTRLSFPNSEDDSDSLGYSESRNEPVGFFEFAPSNDKSLQALYYSQLYFLEGIKETLSFLQEDTTGEIRGTDLNEFPVLPYYTRWNETDYLPHPRFEDADFNDADDQPSMTAAALLGKNVRRYGGAVTTIGDKLWRAAHFHPGVANDREGLLGEASEHLRCHMHAQFLASLPLAATLDDGLASEPDSNGNVVLTNNEYQEVSADIVRTNITASQILAGRITRGERPKQVDLVPRWDRDTVNNKLASVASLKATTQQAWSDARTAIQQNDSAVVNAANDRLLRRDRYKFRLWQITGIHPDSQAEFQNLNTEEGRDAYLQFVQEWVEAKTVSFDAADSWHTQPLSGFTDPVSGTSPTDVSDMGLAALRMMQAFNELKVAKSRIDSIPQRIAIEDNRNNSVNQIVTDQGIQVAALDVAVATADFVRVSVCACGLGSGVQTEYNAKAVTEAAQAVIRQMINTNTTTGINNANSKATVENLLIEQGILIEQLPSTVIQAQLAVSELQRLYAEAEQLVEDFEYHQDSTGSLWYNDPELVFEQEAAEKRYQDLVRTYQVELYILAKMLEKAWVEPYENPVLNAVGAYEQFAADPRFDLFPDAEAVFSVGNHDQTSDFWDALKSWNNYLLSRRGSVSGGRSTNIGNAIEVSLRQHILGLNDLTYDQPAGSGRFGIDPVLRNENIRRFRSYMLRQAEQASAEGLELRIDFPVNLNQLIEVDGLGSPLYLFGSAGVSNANIWNRRLLGVGTEIVGHNVTQGQPTKPNRFPASLYLHGTVSREGKFLDSIYTQSNRTIRTDLALFQNDPLDLTVTGSNAIFAVEDYEVTANNLQPDPGFNPQMPLIEWPFACDNVVFVVRQGNASFNWENIDDILFYIFWEAGPPVSTGSNYDWPN
ncbi:hypothetical protein [Roseibacillus ishigakijimensis]|uniref:Uncharacterized protein n=1 Tax=Roseibacillus ishigakijimensis TaxID=454146 RepID=A0A934VNF3_9BACT|nr:hypothetical protein [Roseibacillus ishigakijimensis]MBK1835051.1 hypothetical protein [Roseibacillus ishigakijimensis]